MKKLRNVVLDLDNTLICAEASTDFPFDDEKVKKKAMQFDIHDMDGYYIVFERPKVQQFLDYLFENYNVSIWTAASKDYALFIIKHIILKNPKRKLDYIFFSYHCDISNKIFDSSKNLDLLFKVFELQNYNKTNTVIIDDLKEVWETQPQNCVRIKYFDFFGKSSGEDDELHQYIIPELDNK